MTGTVEKPGPTVSPDELASALAQLKLQNRPADPGQVMRGDQNSLRAKQLDALLQGTGRPVSDITAPLRAADQMLHLHAANSSGGPPRMGMGQMLLRPFRTLDMMITAHNEAGVQREIAHLLQDPNNLPELRKIAMFDPTVRKQLSLMSGLAGGLATSEGAR
jgi:hypothetical protein